MILSRSRKDENQQNIYYQCREGAEEEIPEVHPVLHPPRERRCTDHGSPVSTHLGKNVGGIPNIWLCDSPCLRLAYRQSFADRIVKPPKRSRVIGPGVQSLLKALDCSCADFFGHGRHPTIELKLEIKWANSM